MGTCVIYHPVTLGFLFASEIKGVEGWKEPVCGVKGKTNQGRIERLCTELMALLKLYYLKWH